MFTWTAGVYSFHSKTACALQFLQLVNIELLTLIPGVEGFVDSRPADRRPAQTVVAARDHGPKECDFVFGCTKGSAIHTGYTSEKKTGDGGAGWVGTVV